MKITRETFLACQQLLDEAKRKKEQLEEIESELANLLIVAEDMSGYYGHVSDAVYGEGDFKIKTLLGKLKYSFDSKSKKVNNNRR